MKIKDKEIAWLKRDKYGGDEVRLRAHPVKSLRSHGAGLKSDFKRLVRGEPIDYVIGWREFLGCRIDLSFKPFIPRAETEFWVGEVIKELCEVGLQAPRSPTSHNKQLIKVLDLFAGSGCIGLAILKHCLNVKMTFGEKEKKFVKQIKKNLKLNFPSPTILKDAQGSSGGVRVVQTDIFSNIPGRFDFNFANPPDISTRQKVQKSIMDWEPKKALLAGDDGLVFIKKFLKEAKDHLKANGKIYLEFGYGQKLAVAHLLKQFGYVNHAFHKDQFGKWRWVTVE